MQIASSRYAGISSMHGCLTLELVQSAVSKEQRNKYEASNPSGECTYIYIHKIIMRSAIFFFCIFVCAGFFFCTLSVSVQFHSHTARIRTAPPTCSYKIHSL